MRVIVLMQPRGGTGSTEPPATPPADPPPAGSPAPPPAADPGTPAAPAAPSGTGPDVNTTVVVNADPSGLELSQQLCQSASRNMLIAEAGYDLGGVVLGLLLFFIMKKRLWSTVAIRYVASLVLSITTAAVLVGLDPVRADDLKRCLSSGEFSRYVMLGQSEIARALAFGVGPTLLVTLLGCFAINRLL